MQEHTDDCLIFVFKNVEYVLRFPCGKVLLTPAEAGGHRYEGTWKDGKKHGPGRFFFPDKGQLYEGVWAHDIAKCGTLIDSGRK